jgi:hypothetical protein
VSRPEEIMPILEELFGMWIGILSLSTIAFILGVGAFLFLFVRRQMKQ